MANLSVREASLDEDGWRLLDATAVHREYPDSFEIPDVRIRNALAVGDFAKLMFSIGIADDSGGVEVVERMWVVVCENAGDRYFGLLDNEPDCIDENDRFWRGVEVPFGPEHVIDVMRGDDQSVALSRTKPLRRWPR